MGQDLPATSYALLGLLSFGPELTGYQLKQWADASLRFFWVAPAMSHVYREVARLEQAGLVVGRDVVDAGRSVRAYRITAAGQRALATWVRQAPVEFPVLKHSVALRLFLGHVVGEAHTRRMLDAYLSALEQRLAELRAVRERLSDDPDFASAARVADWGLRYYRFEMEAVADIAAGLEDDRPPAAARRSGQQPDQSSSEG